jgi:hypothetical protein
MVFNINCKFIQSYTISNKLLMKKKQILIFVLLFALKAFISLEFEGLKLNPDEETNYTIAQRYHNKLGYTIIVNNKSVPTAFHGSGSIFLYMALLKANISKKAFIWFWFILSNVGYLFSLLWVYRLGGFYLTEKNSFYTAVIYGVFPSTIYFIGALFTYESICTYLLIYFMLVIVKLYKTGIINSYNYITIPLLATISCLLRPQLLAFYIPAFFILPFLFLKTAQFKSDLKISIASIILIILVHIPILEKNENIFGARILSTQDGFELLQGHSAVARGSWLAAFNKKGNVLYEYSHKNIPGLDTLNEYNESLARKKLAIMWIKNNPVGEFKLTMRKLAIYFLPQNYEVLPGYSFYNPFNLLIYLLFLLSVLYIILNRNSESFTDKFILFLPIGFSIAISIIFFVGYRWRFYAEPFMILFAFIYLQRKVTNFRSTSLQQQT